MGRLAGKIAFISGTGAGIGRAAAQVFAAESALVFDCDIAFDRDIDEGRDAETVEPVENADGVLRIPSGRVGGPEDIAHVAAFLRSGEAAFVNGVNPVAGSATAG
ncbi:hypothetical protein OK074_1240 [Actinobacteria bacterium OK074]|nr:hypothetical protein OK074_1240 [Actinobacteria bacterium OK074]